jgi:hypothetical protein
VPLQLKRHGFAEARGGVIGLLLQHFVEIFGRGFRLFQVQQCDAESQPRVQPIGLRFGRFLEEIGSFLPATQPLQANRQIQVRVGVPGMHAEQLGVALRGVLVHLQFELDLGFGGEHFERALPSLQNAVDLG